MEPLFWTLLRGSGLRPNDCSVDLYGRHGLAAGYAAASLHADPGPVDSVGYARSSKA
jgi:hypothetical protein